jgi:hypothetical protein
MRSGLPPGDTQPSRRMESGSALPLLIFNSRGRPSIVQIRMRGRSDGFGDLVKPVR